MPPKPESIIVRPRTSMWLWLRWVLLSITILLIVASIFLFGFMHIRIVPLDGDNPPQFIQADFVELDKIYAVSKFRSGVGHDFSVNSGETCRSMKHYFSSMDPDQPNYKMNKEMEMIDWAHPVEGVDVTIFSPVDGWIERVDHDQSKGWVGDEIVVRADSQKSIRIRLMHVTPISDNIQAGTRVTAGQKIGLVLANQSFDIAISSMSIFKESYISYFAAMPDEIFVKYQARGSESRDEYILSREEVDANPWECVPGTEQFIETYNETAEDIKRNMVYLSGYDEVEEIANQQWSASQDQDLEQDQEETPSDSSDSGFTLITPYVNESDISSINEAYSKDPNNPYWGFTHQGVDFMTTKDLVPFQATASGTISTVTFAKEDGPMGWHVGFCIQYDETYGACYNFETFSQAEATGQKQMDNIFVQEGDILEQGDLIGNLVLGQGGTHVDFGVNVPGDRICPEPFFTEDAKASVLRLIQKDHPSWPICDS